MGKNGRMRHGSLQFWPRKRARKVLPRVSWNALTDKRSDIGLLGFIGYKVGMMSAYVRDNLGSSLTKNQRITIPVTIIEFPNMRFLSVRFYKNNKVVGDILCSNLDREVKKKVKLPKEVKKKIEDFKEGDYDDIRVIVYSQVKKTGIKKKPDVCEIGLSGELDEKLSFVKENMNKELSAKDFLNESVLKEDYGLVDVRGVTKGKGLQGPTKRFGLSLRFHKSEKGVRGPGSGGPWHPARVEFTQPMAGQMGYFSRVVYNNNVILVDDINERNINPPKGFKKYGEIKNNYVVVSGSVQGPSKRQLLVTLPLRPNSLQGKKDFEFIELR
jgi:large subunit ribosomal protein L3